MNNLPFAADWATYALATLSEDQLDQIKGGDDFIGSDDIADG